MGVLSHYYHLFNQNFTGQHDIASVSSHLVIRTRRFWKIKEKKIEKKINIDLAIIASQCSERQFMTVFFIGKKDGGKRMVMDYRKLNRQTVKNNYPLPLITELVDNMGSKQVFTKMDLR